MDNKNAYKIYNSISNWYDQHRNKELIEKKYLDLILEMTPNNATILDVGCGTGEPIALYLRQQGSIVTGVDASEKMIELCQKRYPNGEWLKADMRALQLQRKFDALITWNSLFHLNHADQRLMFKIFASHLNESGILAFTSGPEEGESWGDNGGEALYHASLSHEEYKALLKTNHFKVIKQKTNDPECGNATIWIAKMVTSF